MAAARLKLVLGMNDLKYLGLQSIQYSLLAVVMAHVTWTGKTIESSRTWQCFPLELFANNVFKFASFV